LLALCWMCLTKVWPHEILFIIKISSIYSYSKDVGSVAEKVKAPFLRQPCDCDVGLSSTSTFLGQVVAPLDKTLYDDCLCLMASNKQQIKWYKEVKKATGKLGNGQLLSGCGFVQNTAPQSLSRERRIKMKQTNKGSLVEASQCLFQGQ